MKELFIFFLIIFAVVILYNSYKIDTKESFVDPQINDINIPIYKDNKCAGGKQYLSFNSATRKGTQNQDEKSCSDSCKASEDCDAYTFNPYTKISENSTKCNLYKFNPNNTSTYQCDAPFDYQKDVYGSPQCIGCQGGAYGLIKKNNNNIIKQRPLQKCIESKFKNYDLDKFNQLDFNSVNPLSDKSKDQKLVIHKKSKNTKCVDKPGWISNLNSGWDCAKYTAYFGSGQGNKDADCKDTRDKNPEGIQLNQACCICGGGAVSDDACTEYEEQQEYNKNMKIITTGDKKINLLNAEIESTNRSEGCHSVKTIVPQNDSGVCSATNPCSNGNAKCLGLDQSVNDGGCNSYCDSGIYRSDLGGCIQDPCACPTSQSCDQTFSGVCKIKTCVSVLGPIGIGPWGPCPGFPDQNAKWIWDAPNSEINADCCAEIPFFKKYYAMDPIAVKIYCIVDNSAKITLNGKVLGNASAGWGSVGTVFNAELEEGNNMMVIYAQNLGADLSPNPAGLLVTVLNANNNSILFSSDQTWVLRDYNDITTPPSPWGKDPVYLKPNNNDFYAMTVGQDINGAIVPWNLNNGKTMNDSPIILWNALPDGKAVQKWIYKPITYDYGNIVSAYDNNYALCVRDNLYQNNQPVVVGLMNPGSSFNWSISSGKEIVCADNKNFCISITYNIQKDASKIMIYQRWQPNEGGTELNKSNYQAEHWKATTTGFPTTLPRGTWINGAQNFSVNGSTLIADLPNNSGKLITASTQFIQGDSFVNYNGAFFSANQIPGGSWIYSAQNYSAHNGLLTSSLETQYGSWNNTETEFIAGQTFANINGKFVCTSNCPAPPNVVSCRNPTYKSLGATMKYGMYCADVSTTDQNSLNQCSSWTSGGGGFVPSQQPCSDIQVVSCRRKIPPNDATPGTIRYGTYCTDSTTNTDQQSLNVCTSWTSDGGGFYASNQPCNQSIQ